MSKNQQQQPRLNPMSQTALATTPSRSPTPNADRAASVTTPSRLPPIPSPNDRRAPPPLSFPGAESTSPGKHFGASRGLPASGAAGAADASTLDRYASCLRREVLALQAALDGAARRNTLSFEARKVEAEVLASSQMPSAEERMAAVLELAARKSAELAALAGERAGGADSSADASPARQTVGGRRDAAGGPAALLRPLFEAVLAGRTLPPSSRPASSSSEQAANTPGDTELARGEQQQSASLPAEVASRLKELGVRVPAVEGGSVVVSVVDLVEDLADRLQQLQTKVANLQQSSPAGPKSTPSAKALKMNQNPPPVDRVDDATSTAASPVLATTAHVLLHQQTVIELEALRGALAARDRELNDLRHQLSASRYAFNAPRTLTTVHDAPMSFEVERQYQKELHRLSDRVRELEAANKDLYAAGDSDRRRVVALTAETERLNERIQRDALALRELRGERDEQQSLFTGVSKARGEEARMSLVAVKQLESRVADLEDKLRRKTDEANFLADNARAIWDSWHAADSELNRALADLGESRDLFEAYSSVYNDQMAAQLEEALREMHRLGRSCDEQMALTTIQKQKLDDAEMLRALTVQEQQLWMERLKGSTEWKMLSVKSPDETKQLAVRLMMLTGEKEKKENTMLSSHTERLGLFKARADREVAERCERREAAMPMIDSEAVKARWHGEEDTVCKRYAREREAAAASGQGGRTTKLRYADVKDRFFAEMRLRTVDFRQFFNDEVEALAAQEVGGAKQHHHGK